MAISDWRPFPSSIYDITGTATIDSSTITSDVERIFSDYIGEIKNDRTLYSIQNRVDNYNSHLTSLGYDTNIKYNVTNNSIEYLVNNVDSTNATTGSTITNWRPWDTCNSSTGSSWPIISVQESKRDIIRAGLVPNINIRGSSVIAKAENEEIAIETLREEISESEFRKYMKYGFVLVQGKSGKTYQVFRNASHTKVWKGGKLIEEVCVRIKDKNIPPTDNVIAFKTMIEIDEEEFRKSGNVYKRKAA